MSMDGMPPQAPEPQAASQAAPPPYPPPYAPSYAPSAPAPAPGPYPPYAPYYGQPYAQPMLRRPPKPPLSQFTNARRVIAHYSAFLVFGALFTALAGPVGNAVGSPLTQETPASMTPYAIGTGGVSLVIFLGGFWWWCDAVMLRARRSMPLRLIIATLLWLAVIVFVGVSVIAIILLTLAFGNPDGLAWLAAYFTTMVVISLAAIPAFIVGELVGGTPQSRARA